jgi:hypothetical protein
MAPHELKVPWGLSKDDRLVKPAEAQRSETYMCPACQTPLVFRQGPHRQAHFAHYHESCSQESILHISAKRLIEQVVQEWKAGAVAITLHRQCTICGDILLQALPDKVQDASLEKRTSSGHVVDVALLAEESIVAAVEIRVTHAVDDQKRAQLPIPYIELDAEAVLEAPYDWHPIADTLSKARCEVCRSAYSYHQTRCSQLAQEAGLELPQITFRYGITTCSSCETDILVFTWPGHSVQSTEALPLTPAPFTIKQTYSNSASESYYMNHCPYCNTGQGDRFLYTEREGPFYNFMCGEDSEIDFWIDQHRIARGLGNRYQSLGSVKICPVSNAREAIRKLLPPGQHATH